MRINELITESKEQLDEGPLGTLGSMAGKAVGGLAKGIGAVAGGVVGAGRALKKGYQTGKAVVGDDPDPNAGAPGYQEPAAKAAAPAGGGNAAGGAQPAATPAGGGNAAPAQQPAPQGGAQQPAAEPAPQGGAQQPKPTGDPKGYNSAAKPANGQPADAAAKSGTPYKAAQDAVAKLDKRGKQNLLKLLQKEFPQAAPAAEKPAAGAPAAPAAGAAAQPAAEKPAAAATPAAEPTAPAAEPTAAPTGAAPAAQPAATQQTAADADAGKPGFMQSKIKGRRPAAKPSQAEIDADRDRIMGVTSDSIIRTGNKLAETLASRVEHHKRKMFEASIAKGEFRVFK